MPGWDVRRATSAADANAVRTAEEERAAKAGWKVATTWAGKVEAGVAAAVRGREAAGLAEGRTQEKGAAVPAT